MPAKDTGPDGRSWRGPTPVAVARTLFGRGTVTSSSASLASSMSALNARFMRVLRPTKLGHQPGCGKAAVSAPPACGSFTFSTISVGRSTFAFHYLSEELRTQHLCLYLRLPLSQSKAQDTARVGCGTRIRQALNIESGTLSQAEADGLLEQRAATADLDNRGEKHQAALRILCNWQRHEK